MGEATKIQFSTATWNPWQGCIKVSPGCKFCYMYRDKEWRGQDPLDIHRSANATFDLPMKWQRQSKSEIIFTCSWSDWFIQQADAWRHDAWKIVKATPEHFYLIFTKRSERINACLPADWGTGYPNVMLVATAENQEMADKRSAELLKVPAAWRGLSLEPLIGPVDVREYLHGLDWLVIGGESGNENGYYRYRPCEFNWLNSLVVQGREADVPVFVKQMGTFLAKKYNMADRHGGNINDFPESLRIRQHIPYVAENFSDRL